jgi:hypothetical protein
VRVIKGKKVYYVFRLVRNVILMLIAFGAAPHVADAQTHSAGERFVAFRAGANLVGNTQRVRETKAEPGAGGAIGTYMSQVWALEFETWVRAANPICCADARQAETLFSLSVIRFFAAGGLRPYMVGGLTLMHGHDSELQVQVGVGAQFPLRSRFEMAIDLRGNGGGSTMVVRPTVSLIYHF